MKKTSSFVLLLAAVLSNTTLANSAPMTDKDRIDALIKQNTLLVEENSRLRELAERPKTVEEVFASCMQATKGQSAMAASSTGDHCRRILKK